MAETIYKISNKILKIGGKLLTVSGGSPTPPPTPVLPDYTIRLKYQEGVTPTFRKGTAVQVSSSPNIWDLTYENSDWNDLLFSHTSLLEVIDANSTGVSNVSNMFAGCTGLTSVPLFDTSSITNMAAMFMYCFSLTSVPLLDTSSVDSMDDMFSDCTNVQSGALALYQQASGQSVPPTDHDHTFSNCGRNTVTGAAELAQIPADWK